MAPAYYHGLYSPKEPSGAFVVSRKKEGYEDMSIDYAPMKIPGQFATSFMLPQGLPPTTTTMVDMLVL